MKESGAITVIKPVEKFSSKKGDEFQKLEFVISNNEGYQGAEQIFCFEVFGEEKVEQFLKYNKVGRSVEVEFNIKTRAYEDRHFTSLQAWKISKANDTETALQQAAAVIDNAFPPATDLKEVEDDGLPF